MPSRHGGSLGAHRRSRDWSELPRQLVMRKSYRISHDTKRLPGGDWEFRGSGVAFEDYMRTYASCRRGSTSASTATRDRPARRARHVAGRRWRHLSQQTQAWPRRLDATRSPT